MRGLIRLVAIFPAVAAGLGAGVLALWSIGEVESVSFPVGDAERGAYLARTGGCVSCHTNAAAKTPALAGGAPLDTPFGTFVPPNITPHPVAGIGRWTIQDFARAVRQGVSPQGEPYYPVFTYSFYAGFTDQDIADLWEAFRTVPPVAEAAPDHDLGFPFSFRSGLKLWRAKYLDAPVTDALMGTSSPLNRDVFWSKERRIARPATRAETSQVASRTARVLPGMTACPAAARPRRSSWPTSPHGASRWQTSAMLFSPGFFRTAMPLAAAWQRWSRKVRRFSRMPTAKRSQHTFSTRKALAQCPHPHHRPPTYPWRAWTIPRWT